MRFEDQIVLCEYGGSWQVCKALPGDYPTLEAVKDGHEKVNRPMVVVPENAVTVTLMLLNGRRPTLSELADGYDADKPW